MGCPTSSLKKSLTSLFHLVLRLLNPLYTYSFQICIFIWTSHKLYKQPVWEGGLGPSNKHPEPTLSSTPGHPLVVNLQSQLFRKMLMLKFGVYLSRLLWVYWLLPIRYVYCICILYILSSFSPPTSPIYFEHVLCILKSSFFLETKLLVATWLCFSLLNTD